MTRVALLVALSLGLFSYHTADAQNCERYKDRADHYAKLRRSGGSSARMARWQNQRNRYNALYRDCQRKASSTSIKMVTGSDGSERYADRRKPRRINTNDQVVRTLLETCNYWIREHNARPTRDSLSQRDYACSAADRGQRESDAARIAPAQHTRSLNECIKPGNVIDDDVAACLQGKVSPNWREESDDKTNRSYPQLIPLETEPKP